MNLKKMFKNSEDELKNVFYYQEIIYEPLKLFTRAYGYRQHNKSECGFIHTYRLEGTWLLHSYRFSKVDSILTLKFLKHLCTVSNCKR